MKTKDVTILKQRLLSSIPSRYAHLSALMLAGTAAGVVTLLAPHAAHAYSFYNGQYDGQQLEINLDTTVGYSNIFRVNNPSKVLLANVNGDEGDRQFPHGMVSNEFEVNPIFDVKYGNYGLHVSGEAYLNTVYLQKGQDHSAATLNPISITDPSSFTSATRNQNGENAKLLDAFVYGSEYFGANNQQEITVKIGRQTQLWGQSLLIAGDGISAAMAPIDIQFAQSNPNALASQVFLPTAQVVVTYQPNTVYTLQAYYQSEWAPDNFQGVGSYFSSADILDKGGQRILVGGPYGLYRIKDNRPPIGNGQFGVSLQATLGNFDLGVYALRYDSKTPEIYVGAPDPSKGPSIPQGGVNAGSYWLVYPRDLQLYGASISTTIGPANVAGEISYRPNVNLDSGLGGSAYPGNANGSPAWAVGRVLNEQISTLYISPPLPLDPGGLSFLGEFVSNTVLGVSKNKAALAPGRDATAGQIAFQLTPTYFFAAVPNVQWNFPIGFGMGVFNRSQFDQTENNGVGHVNVSIQAIYKQTWTAEVTYYDYLGKANALNPTADRGYVGFNLTHTF
ncbi:hypothetical protein GCM10010909_03820 [Acidocella aquatica]|uniref:DUF1302 domain-containing protein n=1 Tax=Acidocella aquatica TaxID=1922313 RepID=A0ABQ6A0J5_9PROT|nr:DUF1302 family protein [Acidocella aquatica]GLR65704.1 hypothetical protein GCM10010909_03820 [Acidocella aquatica]